MWNEENVMKGKNGASRLIPYRSPELELYRDLPVCKSFDEVEKITPRNSGEIVVVNATERVVNEYLNQKFGNRNIYDFMELYFNWLVGRPIYFSITAPMITCILRKVYNVNQLNNQSEIMFSKRASSVLKRWHDSSVCLLTLVECQFDIDKYHSKFLGYCPAKTEHYRYQIMSSIQCDFTILYERIG
jgi:hypothetical protein